MEAVISNLLSAFENGRVSRRQLVRSLAVAVGGAAVLGGAETAEAATKGTGSAGAFKTASLDHISYQVSDYGRSRDFYADLMGWEVADDDGERQALMHIGDAGSIIVRNAFQPISIPSRGGKPVTSLIDHISWTIEDWDPDHVREELESRGLEPRRDQNGGPTYDSFHVKDPDGWDLQISNESA
jgi:catechol 2,3-dioxygenase-like lactoylglutathione lyase family enzyme